MLYTQSNHGNYGAKQWVLFTGKTANGIDSPLPFCMSFASDHQSPETESIKGTEDESAKGFTVTAQSKDQPSHLRQVTIFLRNVILCDNYHTTTLPVFDLPKFGNFVSLILYACTYFSLPNAVIRILHHLVGLPFLLCHSFKKP